ncbi:MAG: reverse transcriptase domain-containing protein, partial [Lactococcus lactis]
DASPVLDEEPGIALSLAEAAFSAEDLAGPTPELYPRTYRQALATKDELHWLIAHKHELRNCESRRVWRIVKKCNVPKGRKIIGNRWVFAKKDDGRFRARTVSQGYSQVPGKDFHENHAHVINDTIFHLILIMMLIHGLYSEQFDIETAFLYGNLDEEIYMEFPDGYEEFLKTERGEKYSSDEYCVLLFMALYGLVQAARQWYKKITSIFAKLHFFPSTADPCLFVRRIHGQPPAFIILYVDDGAIIGSKSLIKEVMTALSNELKVKSLGPLKHFVGCHLIRSDDGKSIFIHQPKLLKHLEDSFGQYCKENKYYLSPAAPKTVIVRPEADMPLISPTSQTQYRSGVGMLLYLVKHSRPDLSNAVRELTKVLDKATIAHWKALLRTIKFVFDTKSYALKLQPSIRKDSKYDLEVYSDSEFAGDPETRMSVYGYITFFCGAPVSWKSKSNRCVTLSSTEAEYYAASEAAMELL